MSPTDLPEFTHWKPADISLVKTEFKSDWILAGGHALATFAGKSYRTHADIDVIIKRRDQHLLHTSFAQERIWVAEVPGKLTSYHPSTFYEKPVQDIWVLNANLQFWMLQVMLVDDIEGQWIFKRNEEIRLPWDKIYFESKGLKILKPEIQLLYKLHEKSDKSKVDFQTIYPLLSAEAKQWLAIQERMIV